MKSNVCFSVPTVTVDFNQLHRSTEHSCTRISSAFRFSSLCQHDRCLVSWFLCSPLILSLDKSFLLCFSQFYVVYTWLCFSCIISFSFLSKKSRRTSVVSLCTCLDEQDTRNNGVNKQFTLSFWLKRNDEKRKVKSSFDPSKTQSRMINLSIRADSTKVNGIRRRPTEQSLACSSIVIDVRCVRCSLIVVEIDKVDWWRSFVRESNYEILMIYPMISGEFWLEHQLDEKSFSDEQSPLCHHRFGVWFLWLEAILPYNKWIFVDELVRLLPWVRKKTCQNERSREGERERDTQ